MDAWLGKVERLVRLGRKEECFQGEMGEDYRKIEERGKVLREMKEIAARVRDHLEAERKRGMMVHDGFGLEGGDDVQMQ